MELHAVGLSGQEEAAYEALLDRSPATLAELRELSGLPTLDLSTLASLQAKGLASRLAGRPTRYAVTPPDVALEMLIRAREEELQRARLVAARLTERFRQTRRATSPEDVVEIVVGRDAVLQRCEQVQRSARKTVRCFDRPPYTNPADNPVEIELLGQGLMYQCVYERAGLTAAGRMECVQELIRRGEQARVVNDLPVKMFLADDQLGLISLQRPVTTDAVLVINSSSLLDTLSALFEAVWDRGTPLGMANDGQAATELAAEDTRLLTLLAAGLTDEAIGRQLGWHARTVQRRVRRMMDTLGVRTRFQAGLHAARRGWL